MLLDTALRRGEPVGDMIDALTTHFGLVGDYDLDKDGRVVSGKTLHLQYPGAKAIKDGARFARDTGYPEVAIDFNRCRLGRTVVLQEHGLPSDRLRPPGAVRE